MWLHKVLAIFLLQYLTKRLRPATYNEPAVSAGERNVDPLEDTAVLCQNRSEWNARPGALKNEERRKKWMHSNAEDRSTYYVPGTHEYETKKHAKKDQMHGHPFSLYFQTISRILPVPISCFINSRWFLSYSASDK